MGPEGKYVTHFDRPNDPTQDRGAAASNYGARTTPATSRMINSDTSMSRPITMARTRGNRIVCEIYASGYQQPRLDRRFFAHRDFLVYYRSAPRERRQSRLGGNMLDWIWDNILAWLPSAAAIASTVVVLIGMRLIISRAGSERDAVPYRRQLISFALALTGVFAAIILMPIESELRTQILSLTGVLLSAVVALSSTSLVGNAMAGIMMRLAKSYRPGDFIEVEDVLGRVTNQGLFHTEVQLITRDIATLPNLYLSQHPIQVTRSSGTFVSIEVSLGYELNAGHVEQALKDAVAAAGLEEPFVLVDRLLDHAIIYQVYGLLEDVSRLLTARSRLRRSVVTTLHARGIQIVSPQYVNRVEFSQDHEFVPSAPEQKPGENGESFEESDKVEAIAFDKAEEAESIERLYALEKELETRRSELDEKIKSTGDSDEKRSLKEERQEINRRLERTKEIVARREEEAREAE
ncbi:MAG: mechanosensitive ion channel domain-containing protein [Spirochaetales bacterium]